MPDFFSPEKIKEDNVIWLCNSDGMLMQQQWTENIEEWKPDNDKIDMMMMMSHHHHVYFILVDVAAVYNTHNSFEDGHSARG